MESVSATEADAVTVQEAPIITVIRLRNVTARMVENACMLILFFVFASASYIAKSVPKLQSYDFQWISKNIWGVRFCTIRKNEIFENRPRKNLKIGLKPKKYGNKSENALNFRKNRKRAAKK